MIVILRTLLSGDTFTILRMLIAYAIVFLTALPIHEAAHGFVANKLGDPTAKNLGRITLNPVKHFDPMGTIALLLFGYGWAKPVPINPNNFKNRKNGMALSALAGPVSNILLATIFSALSKIVFYTNPDIRFSYEGGLFAMLTSPLSSETVLGKLGIVFIFIFDTIVSVNVTIASFNLLPIPPLDGSKIIGLFLSHKAYYKYEAWTYKYQQYIFYGMLAVFFVLPLMGGTFGMLSRILYFPFDLLQRFIYFIIDFLTGFIDLIFKIV